MSESAANPARPRFGIAITTVGRWDELRALLEDLANQTQPPHAVAIAHHNPDAADSLAALVQTFADKLAITTVLSPRGVSNGRNAAAATFGDDVDWICFPNDTSRLDAGYLELLARYCVPPATMCAVQLRDREGIRNVLPARGTPLTLHNVWGAIEPATAIKRRDFELVGGFDPGLGSGAQTPWQAGEGVDLTLRLAKLEGFSVDWISDIVVHAHTEFAHLPPAERCRKQRSYGRGSGYILRVWDYSFWYKVRHVIGAGLMPLRNPKKFGPREGLSLMIGRIEGVLGRELSVRSDYRAVLR